MVHHVIYLCSLPISELWLGYVRFETQAGHVEQAKQVFLKAKKALKNPTAFIRDYNALLNGSSAPRKGKTKEGQVEADSSGEEKEEEEKSEEAETNDGEEEEEGSD